MQTAYKVNPSQVRTGMNTKFVRVFNGAGDARVNKVVPDRKNQNAGFNVVHVKGDMSVEQRNMLKGVSFTAPTATTTAVPVIVEDVVGQAGQAIKSSWNKARDTVEAIAESWTSQIPGVAKVGDAVGPQTRDVLSRRVASGWGMPVSEL